MMLAFKSDAHRLMFQNMLKLQIKSGLSSRFGGFRQEECRVLRSKAFIEFLTLWSNSIINNMPKEPRSQSEYINRNVNSVSDEVLELPEVKSLMESDSSLKWLVGRINSDKDNVPKPYFPSLLRNNMMQFPFRDHDIHKSRNLYGLLKFPFYKLSTSLYAESSESFKGLTEPKTDEDLKLESDSAENPAESPRKHQNYFSSNYIYSPSELETGLEDS